MGCYVFRRVTLLTVTLLFINPLPPINAETTCSDRAYDMFLKCMDVMKSMHNISAELDLYSDWELRIMKEEAEKCEKFWANKGRERDCMQRATEEFMEREFVNLAKKCQPFLGNEYQMKKCIDEAVKEYWGGSKW